MVSNTTILNDCQSSAHIIEIINFDEICRICWRTDNLKSVFNEDIPSLCEMLMACSPLEVCEENGLPTKLCGNCTNELESAFAFRNKCIDSDLKLKKYLQDNGIETTIQYTHDPLTEETIETIHTTVVVKDESILHYDDNVQDVLLKEKQLTVGNTVFSINNPVESTNLTDRNKVENNEILFDSTEPVSNYEIVETNNVDNIINNCVLNNDDDEKSQQIINNCELQVNNTVENKKYTCNYCQRSYLHPRNLKRHINEYHSGKLRIPKSGSRNFRCSICRRLFSFKNALIRHLRFIHREITAKCFKFVNGKKCCTSEINLFIENTNENSKEVKGILADIENAPDLHTSDDNSDNYGDMNSDIIRIKNESIDNIKVESDEMTTDTTEDNNSLNEELNITNNGNEILIEDLLKNNDGSIQILQQDNQMILVVGEQLFNKIAQIETTPNLLSTSSSSIEIKEEKQSGAYECCLCKQKFNLRFSLKRHLKLIHNILEIITENPNIDIANTKEMIEIINELKTETKALGYEITDATTEQKEQNTSDGGDDKQQMATIDSTENNKIKYFCNLCDKSYYAKTNLHRHIKDKHLPKMKEPEKLFKCDMCERAFIRKGLLERHKDTHFERVAFQCEQCGDIFDKKTKLRQHVVKHDTQKKFQCDVCHKWFLRATTLRVHKKQHASVLPYPCPECERAFSMRPALEAHIRTHSESRPYVCDICRRAFRHPGHLETHKKLHTGERPYGCKMCSKRFTTSTHLKYHTKVHLDQRDFKCEICGRAFIHSSELKYHMVSHTQIKERPCPVCNKLFARTNQVTKHLRQVHKLRKNYYAY